MRSILFLILAASVCLVFAQTEAVLDENNTSITVGGKGFMFFGYKEPVYIVPKPINSSDVKKSTIFASSLWIGAIDENDTLHVSATLYDDKSFLPGPSSNRTNTSFNKYNKIWVVSSDEIKQHCSNFSKPIEAILTWPGNGDTTIGEPWLLAPFEDLNGNNVYEPKLGEYPKIKGAQAAYCIYTDAQKGFPGNPLNVDVHQLFYQEKMGDFNGAFDKVNLAWFKIVNRSNYTYSDLRIGVFMDSDVGYYSDDYFASDTLRDMIYQYNGDDYDEETNGYGFNPPAQGLKFLNHKMTAALNYFNARSNPFTGSPETALEYYNYLKGLRKTGDTIYQYGNGISGIDSVATTYLYAGDPTKSQGWTEALSNNYPGDRQGIASIGPFTLPPNEAICFDIAYIYGRSTFGGNLQSIVAMRDVAEHVQFAYNQDYNGWKSYECQEKVIASVEGSQPRTIKIYPNPTTGIATVTLPNNETFAVYNALGEQLIDVKKAENQIDLTECTKGLYFVKTRFGSYRLLKY